jgi:serine protease inhibitor
MRLHSAKTVQPIKFEVNRAALFFVYETTNQTILFLGRINDPR